MMTLAPSLARAEAIASPMPAVLPLTRARLPLRPKSISAILFLEAPTTEIGGQSAHSEVGLQFHGDRKQLQAQDAGRACVGAVLTRHTVSPTSSAISS